MLFDRIGQGCHPLNVGGVAVIILLRLGGHTREGVRVDLAGARRDVGDATTGKARRHALGEERQIAQRQKAAVALAERDPGLTAKAHEAQVLKIAHDGAGEVALEEIRLRACGIGACRLGALAQCGNRAPVHAATASGAALVGKDHAEVLDGFLNPAIACGRQRTRALAAGAALQKQEQILCKALHTDLGKSKTEMMCEIGLVQGEIRWMKQHLGRFADKNMSEHRWRSSLRKVIKALLLMAMC